MTRSALSSAADTRAIAEAAASRVPSAMPLAVVPATGDERPAPEALAVVASFVGSPRATFSLVAEAVVAELTEAGVAAGTPVAVTDALRPALEAAAAALGAGILDGVHTESAEVAFSDETAVYALRSDGVTVAWFGVRVAEAHAPAPTVGQVPSQRTSMRVLYDVEMTLTVELGRTRLPLREVLDLAPGAVLELDRTASSPADILVNGRLIARGEVVVVDEDYGVRITQIVSGLESEA
ncbi:MAG TPA: flagellar motor switch protein FliN [Cellulomonas sp.]